MVLISGLGGSGSYWLPQLAVLEQEYQVVCYDQRGTGNNPDTLAEDYSIAQMAAELHQALVAAGMQALRGGRPCAPVRWWGKLQLALD